MSKLKKDLVKLVMPLAYEFMDNSQTDNVVLEVANDANMITLSFDNSTLNVTAVSLSDVLIVYSSSGGIHRTRCSFNDLASAINTVVCFFKFNTRISRCIG